MLSGVVLPFYANYPTAYTQGGSSTTASSTSSSSTARKDASTNASTSGTNPGDVVDVRFPLPGRNFTAEAGDSFSLNDLYDAGPNAYGTVARYRVALRNDPASGGGGRLMLGDKDVTGQVDFSPAEFSNLLFVAGPDGSRQDLVVVARSGTPDGKGGLTGIVDSPAVQISASVTGTRSINAAAALQAPDPAAGDASFLKVAREAEIFRGFGSTSQPSLTTVVHADDPSTLIELLSSIEGAFQASTQSGSTNSASSGKPSSDDLGSVYSGAVGASRSTSAASTTSDSLHALLLLLGSPEVGGVKFGGAPVTVQRQFALQAYLKAAD